MYWKCLSAFRKTALGPLNLWRGHSQRHSVDNPSDADYVSPFPIEQKNALEVSDATLFGYFQYYIIFECDAFI